MYESNPETVFGTPLASGASNQVDDAGLKFQFHLLICSEQPQAMEKRGAPFRPPCSDMLNVEYDAWTNASHGYCYSITYPKCVQQIIRADNLDQDNRRSGPYMRPTFAGIEDCDLLIVASTQSAVWINGTEPVVMVRIEHPTFPSLSNYWPAPLRQTRLKAICTTKPTRQRLPRRGSSRWRTTGSLPLTSRL